MLISNPDLFMGSWHLHRATDEHHCHKGTSTVSYRCKKLSSWVAGISFFFFTKYVHVQCHEQRRRSWNSIGTQAKFITVLGTEGVMQTLASMRF